MSENPPERPRLSETTDLSLPQLITSPPGMGRSIVHHDPKNRAFPARGTLFAEDAPLRTKVWRRGGAYDQDGTSWCVPETGKGMLNTAPFSAWADYRLRSRYPVPVWYDGAQANDQWAGADYDGTSALGLLRYLLLQGVIGEYRWCFGVADVLRTLSYHGPVGIGSWWRSGMDRPGPDGRGMTYTGTYRGGHEWEVIGIHVEDQEVEMLNSWGEGWGDRGRARISYAPTPTAPGGVFGEVLADDGDAFTLVAPGSVGA